MKISGTIAALFVSTTLLAACGARTDEAAGANASQATSLEAPREPENDTATANSANPVSARSEPVVPEPRAEPEKTVAPREATPLSRAAPAKPAPAAPPGKVSATATAAAEAPVAKPAAPPCTPEHRAMGHC